MRPIFQSFCINRFGIGPLHYISSHSDFGFDFAEIFVIEKRLPESARRGVADSPTGRVGEWPILWRGESGSRWLSVSVSRGVDDSPTRWIGESAVECENSPLRWVVALVSRGVAIQNLQNFKQLNQPFKGPIWQKRSQECNVLSLLIYFKVWKKGQL